VKWRFWTVEEMSTDLIQYLGEHFPALELGGALFCSWPIGLRFDLGSRATSPDEIDFVVHRATALFEAVFGPEAVFLVVSQDWPMDKISRRALPHQVSLFQFAREQSVGLHTPERSVEVPDAESDVASTLTWTEQDARSFRYDLIFLGIAHADHARSPATSSV
jgi:hypothetical protein